MPRVRMDELPSRHHEQAAGISAAELAQRVGNGNYLLDVTAADLEAWLLGAGLASVNSAGLLSPTALGLELSRALA